MLRDTVTVPREARPLAHLPARFLGSYPVVCLVHGFGLQVPCSLPHLLLRTERALGRVGEMKVISRGLKSTFAKLSPLLPCDQEGGRSS